ncbi:hypothetical protein JDV02_006178 [Purpureocillium takamizusanense]|uniref:Uncharacterized protein n=1 Tax=Purpureocillium takamizusanense TaxID=2060973 RepID=A0A9Q8QI12_9HYPO|nr:uncharacterized protein JDV02_006178 [Purpureocillium takamizusanense]UNI20050.1 hypothetical protein JDV02_006178 [Purpureocillium takamizusanense]
MAPQASNTGGAAGDDDGYRLPSTVYKAPSRDASQQNLVASEGENATAQQGGPVQPINGAATVNAGANANGTSVSNNQMNSNNINNANNVANNNVRGAGSVNQRSVSAPQTAIDSNGNVYVWTGSNQSSRSVSNGPWTEGFHQVMNQRQQQDGRGSIPAPIGTCRPGASITGNASSAFVKGATVQNGAASAPLPNINTPTTASSNAKTVAESVESAVEQQLASALAPLRFIANNLSQTLRATNQENSDFHEQNNTLSRQLDLQYRQIEQHSENANAQIRALLNLIESQTSNIQGIAQNNDNGHAHGQCASAETVSGLMNQMTQMVTAIPGYIVNVMEHSTQNATLPALYHAIRQAVQTTVQHAVQDAIQNHVQHTVQTMVQSTIQATIQEAMQISHDSLLRAVQDAAQNNLQGAQASMREATNTQTRNALEVVVGTQREAFDNVLRFHIQRSVEFGSEQTQVGTPDSSNAQTFGLDDMADAATVVEGTELPHEEKPAKKRGDKIKAFFKKVFKFGGK